MKLHTDLGYLVILYKMVITKLFSDNLGSLNLTPVTPLATPLSSLGWASIVCVLVNYGCRQAARKITCFVTNSKLCFQTSLCRRANDWYMVEIFPTELFSCRCFQNIRFPHLNRCVHILCSIRFLRNFKAELSPWKCI